MTSEARERFLEDLRARGLLADEEVRTARRLLAEADDAGREVSLSEVLIRAGAAAAKAHGEAAAFDERQASPRRSRAMPWRSQARTDADARDTAELVTPESSGLEVLGRIGRGSQAVVYRCRQVEMDRVVAVKMLHPRAAGEAEARERFLREARAAAVLTHPNIVTIHEIRSLANTVAIIMEYVDGGTLADLLKVRKRFDPAEAVAIVRQVAEGLRAAHDRDLIHRDVKPRNIMLTSEGLVKLADMGLARHVAESDGAEGKAFGTPYYISPEQVTGDPPPDHRTDLYSLGVTFYEMVAGRPPFVADTPQAIMRMHVLQTPPDPRDFVPDLPQTLCWLLAKAMAREPEDRYQSAGDFIEALDRLDLSVEPAEAPRALVEQIAEVAHDQRRRGSRVNEAVGGKAGRREPAGRRPSRRQAARAAPGRSAAGPPAGKRKKMSVSLVGLMAFLAVAAVGGVCLLLLYAVGVFDGEPAPSPRPPEGAHASTETPVEASGGSPAEPLTPMEQSARAALAGALRLEKTPGAWRNDILQAYRNVITFYPDTPAAEDAEKALARLGDEALAGGTVLPEPPAPTHRPETEPEPTHGARTGAAGRARRHRGPRLREGDYPRRPRPLRVARRPRQHRLLE